MKWIILLTVIIGLVFAQGTSKVAAEVNGTSITIDNLKNRAAMWWLQDIGQNRESIPPEQLRWTLDDAIADVLLYSEAVKSGVDKDPDLQRQLDAIKRQLILKLYLQKIVLPSIEVSDEEIQQFYRNDRRYFNPEQFVGVMARLDKNADVAAVRSYLLSLKLPALQADTPDADENIMVELPSPPAGVDAKSSVIPLNDNYYKTLFPNIKSASIGAVLGPPEGDNAQQERIMFVVMKKIPEKKVPLDSVRSEIIDQIRQQKLYDVRQQKIEELKNSATITIHYDAFPPVKKETQP